MAFPSPYPKYYMRFTKRDRQRLTASASFAQLLPSCSFARCEDVLII